MMRGRQDTVVINQLVVRDLRNKLVQLLTKFPGIASASGLDSDGLLGQLRRYQLCRKIPMPFT